MNWSLYKKCLRVILFLDSPKEKEEIILDYQDKTFQQIADASIIHVEEDLPGFLRNDLEEGKMSTSKLVQPLLNYTDSNLQINTTDSNTSIRNDAGTPIVSSVTNLHVKKAQESLLDNKPLVQMFEECGSILNELDRIRPGFQSEDSLDLMEIVKERIMQAMYLSGGKPIDNESEFNILRHSCKETADASNGDQIVEIIEPGVSLEGRVIVKAQVKISK